MSALARAKASAATKPSVADIEQFTRKWVKHYRQLHASHARETMDTDIDDYILQTLGIVVPAKAAAAAGLQQPHQFQLELGMASIMDARELKKLYHWVGGHDYAKRTIVSLYNTFKHRMESAVHYIRFIYAYPQPYRNTLYSVAQLEQPIELDNEDEEEQEDEKHPPLPLPPTLPLPPQPQPLPLQQQDTSSSSISTRDYKAAELLGALCKARSKVDILTKRVLELRRELEEATNEKEHAIKELDAMLDAFNEHFKI